MYGTLFHIRNKNPFNLEVLVDAWPEYQTVVIRPQKEVRPWLLRVRPLTLRTGMRGCSEGPAGRGAGGRILTHLIHADLGRVAWRRGQDGETKCGSRPQSQ